MRLDFSFINEEPLADSSSVKDVKVEFKASNRKVGTLKLNLHTFDLLDSGWFHLRLLMGFTRAHINRLHFEQFLIARDRDWTLERKTLINALGVYSDLVTPVPIPNTAVKQVCGKPTAGEALWEDSTMPIYKAPKDNLLRSLTFLRGGYLVSGNRPASGFVQLPDSRYLLRRIFFRSLE